MNRRDALQSLLAFASLGLTPRWAHAATPRRHLLLVELNGGNDGLNTVVPYADPAYPRLRPSLALARGELLRLDKRLGLHPALTGLHELWERRELAIVNGVGYPQPNRSHFRAIEIWDTASESEEYLADGWVAHALAGDAGRGGAVDAVVIGRNPAPLSGAGLRTVVMDDIQGFLRKARGLGSATSPVANPALAHLLAVRGDTSEAADSFSRRLAQATPPSGFPNSRFGRDLREAATLLIHGVAPPALKVAIGSFDTHANQLGTHARLLGELDAGLSALRSALREAGIWDRVLVMTYSEFGRRAAENASRGTDHGTAAPHFLLGGAVAGGLYGAQPALTALRDDDLVHQVDFRRLYRTVVDAWWGLPTPAAWRQHQALDCLRVG